MYLNEIQDWVISHDLSISKSTIYLMIHNLGISYKLLSKAAAERDEAAREFSALMWHKLTRLGAPSNSSAISCHRMSPPCRYDPFTLCFLKKLVGTRFFGWTCRMVSSFRVSSDDSNSHIDMSVDRVLQMEAWWEKCVIGGEYPPRVWG